MPMFEDIGSPAAAGDETVADQGGPVHSKAQLYALDKLARSMKPKVSGNDADDEAGYDSRSGFDSADSRDYASNSQGDVSQNEASPKAAPDLDLVQKLARFAAQAMQFDDCMLGAMASAPPAEALKVETHAEAQGSVVPKIHGGPPRPETLVTASSPASATLVAKGLTQ